MNKRLWQAFGLDLLGSLLEALRVCAWAWVVALVLLGVWLNEGWGYAWAVRGAATGLLGFVAGAWLFGGIWASEGVLGDERERQAEQAEAVDA